MSASDMGRNSGTIPASDMSSYLRQSASENASIPGDHCGPIQRLPDDAISKIVSSASIAGLNGAILGLLKNSLDAQSTKVTISLDARKGSCEVEDDGLGIPRTEFQSNGGLGRLYRKCCPRANCEHVLT